MSNDNYITPITEIDLMVIKYLAFINTRNLRLVNIYYHQIISGEQIYMDLAMAHATYQNTNYGNDKSYLDLSKYIKKFIHCCVFDYIDLVTYMLSVKPVDANKDRVFILQCVVYHSGIQKQTSFRSIARLSSLVLLRPISNYNWMFGNFDHWARLVMDAAWHSRNINIITYTHNNIYPNATYFRWSIPELLRKYCINGKHHKVIYILETFQRFIDTKMDTSYIFLLACEYGNFDIAKTLWPYCRCLQTNEYFIERAMIFACRYDDLSVLEWLCTLKQNPDFHYKCEAMFRACCYANCLDSACWLWAKSLETGKPINTKISNNFIPKMCSKRGYFELLNWLEEIDI
jgi:hypothetical protein